MLYHFLVSCNKNSTWTFCSWKFNHSKLKDHQGYLKSNDTINLSIDKTYQYPNGNTSQEFLCSHDAQFTIRDDTFQEVVCHDESLGENDEVSKLILFYYYLHNKNTILSFFFIFFSGALSLLNKIKVVL
jgi:hypothetical protein